MDRAKRTRCTILMALVFATALTATVRAISATNHDLTKLIEEKKFRQDLYFRIKGVSVLVPALRDRAEDIPLLADYFLEEAVAETGSAVAGITGAAMNILTGFDWPGNIRQLRNCIRTMVVMCDADKLDVADIPPEIARQRRLAAGSRAKGDLAGVSLNELEKQAIIDTLKKTDNNREKAGLTGRTCRAYYNVFTGRH